jgi:outer membrane protein assembly factor BamA
LKAFQIKQSLNFLLHNNIRYVPGLASLVLLTLFSCSPARYVPEGNYLLSKNHIQSAEKKIPEDQLKSYVLQKPNKKLLGTRFHLFLYNLSNIEKERWPHGWLRKIGEGPVIYEPGLTKSSSDQLRQFLENKGYYQAVVKDTVMFRGRDAIASYSIQFNKPYRIRSITYTFEDTGLISRILPDTINSLLSKGTKFDKDELQKERVRIETLMKELGYYHFSKEYIFYNASLLPDEYAVELTMNFKEFVEGHPDPRTKIKYHPRFIISNVFLNPNYSSITSKTAAVEPQLSFDTTLYRQIHLLSTGKPNLRPNVLSDNNNIIPGEYYQLSKVNRTYRNFSELSIVRYANITFTEKDTLFSTGRNKYLDAHIDLSQKKLQSYQTEIVGTNSAGDLGVRGNLFYQNLNLLRGAEVFNIKLTGAIESLRNYSGGDFKSMKEIGTESNIVFPKFFVPFRFEGFVQRYAPKTSISVSFNYQSRPIYTRSIANGSFSYKWNGSKYLTHSVWPVELNYIQIYEDRSQVSFLDSISRTPLAYSFKDHVVNVARYSVELNNQAIGKSRDFIFTRFNIESAGNLVNLVTRDQFNRDEDTDPYELFKVPYFQYLRSDVDFRYYNVIDRQNRFVYRLFIGAGYPYGNSTTMPYEKKYFSGGPNSIRAWSTRELGPGSDTSRVSASFFPDKNGDIKLEANIEYRFKVFWKMEGAFFIDMGNIWNIRKDENKPGAEFNWNRFHKEIAVGSGFGARFDFSFFLLRFDFGIKLRNPAPSDDGKNWIPVFRDFDLRDLHLRFGIGYPF